MKSWEHFNSFDDIRKPESMVSGEWEWSVSDAVAIAVFGTYTREGRRQGHREIGAVMSQAAGVWAEGVDGLPEHIIGPGQIQYLLHRYKT